jgi:hypothetical protein
MYYYLLYNSSLINDNYPNQKFIVVLSYGSVLYMITHAITFHTDMEFMKVFRSYFWNIFILDIIILAYRIWGADSCITGQENLKLSINLLKNKIYNMMDGNHTIKITDDTNNNVQNQSVQPSSPNMSTPINKIKKQNLDTTPQLAVKTGDIDFSNPFDEEKQDKQSFKDFPSNPLVYNPKIDILPPNKLGPEGLGALLPATGTLPPPMIIKKGSSNDYITPGDTKRPVDEPISTNIKYGFSTTLDDDLDNILNENKSIASDIASVIDLEGF